MKKTLVIGASPNSYRYANMAIHRLVSENIEVYALGKAPGEVAGIPIHHKQEKLNLPNLDTITLYLAPHRQKEMYDWIISLKPKRVIFNPGTENEAFAQMLRGEGIQVIEACTLVMIATKAF